MSSTIDETIATVEQLYASITGQKPTRAPASLPRASAWQDESCYELAIDVPGVEPSQISVRFESGVLRVQIARRPTVDKSTTITVQS